MVLCKYCVQHDAFALHLLSLGLTSHHRYAIFHPLAYLVKLNIEMSMAHLIKKIAMDRSRNSDLFVIPSTNNSALKSGSRDCGSVPPSRQTISMLKSVFGKDQSSPPLAISSLANNEILQTKEFTVRNGLEHDLEMQRAEHHEHKASHRSSFASYTDSVTWADLAWIRDGEAEQNTSKDRKNHTSLSAQEEVHLIRPPPAVLRPA